MKSDPYAIPPVYDPADVKTIEEYRAQAALMGYVFDWRDGTFCDNNGTSGARCWPLYEEGTPEVTLPDDFNDFAFVFDCVTGAVISATLSGMRRDHYKTHRGNINKATRTNLPWLKNTLPRKVTTGDDND